MSQSSAVFVKKCVQKFYSYHLCREPTTDWICKQRTSAKSRQTFVAYTVCLQGQSILWSWKNSGDELHNIVRVGSPDSDVCRIDPSNLSVDD